MLNNILENFDIDKSNKDEFKKLLDYYKQIINEFLNLNYTFSQYDYYI
jgi:hypothetical protein